MASNSYENMQNENRALRAENEVLKKHLEKIEAEHAQLEQENGNLKELVDRYSSSNKVLFAQMEVVHLIFGGRR